MISLLDRTGQWWAKIRRRHELHLIEWRKIAIGALGWLAMMTFMGWAVWDQLKRR